jgi:hypothetical protein
MITPIIVNGVFSVDEMHGIGYNVVEKLWILTEGWQGNGAMSCFHPLI